MLRECRRTETAGIQSALEILGCVVIRVYFEGIRVLAANLALPRDDAGYEATDPRTRREQYAQQD